ncbi:hypothetical protein [Flexivirga endophytica]|nr:hypothetical protein [Flexivirga endophytica]
MGWSDGVDNADAWMTVCGFVVGVALLACTIVLIRASYRDRSQEPLSEAERALRLRLARGEIDVDEFLREQSVLRR